jgi:hypothetical protein
VALAIVYLLPSTKRSSAYSSSRESVLNNEFKAKVESLSANLRDDIA